MQTREERCYRNIVNVLNHYGVDCPGVVRKFTDRVILEKTGNFVLSLQNLTNGGKFERWDYVENHGPTALFGFRERVARESMQIIVHTDHIEADIDRWNPNFGLLPLMCHGIECVIPGETDHFAVAKGLEKRGIRDEVV